MEQYFCNCLNVIANVRGHREVLGNNMITFEVTSSKKDSFFAQSLLDVELGMSGIELAQESLIKKRTYVDWVISTCINCGIDVYCLHVTKGMERVLLPKSLNHGKEELKTRKDSSKYSDILKIKLGDFEEDSSTNNLVQISAKDFSEINTQLNNLTEKLMKAEEEAMMERIRLYKETQELQYRELKIKTNKQKESLLRSIRKRESSQMDSLFDSFNESYFGDAKQTEERDLSTDLPNIRGRSIPIKGMSSAAFDNQQMAQSLPSSAFTSPNKNRNKLAKRKVNFGKVRHRSFSESDDTMFDIEGFHEDKQNDICEPFYESDDDSSGDATSLESSGGYSIPSSRGLNPGDRVYATSVPVSIPLFENIKNSYDPESDDEELKSPSPSHIAASIQALAKSMQDSTSMFGELPRPRVNTFR